MRSIALALFTGLVLAWAPAAFAEDCEGAHCEDWIRGEGTIQTDQANAIVLKFIPYPDGTYFLKRIGFVEFSGDMVGIATCVQEINGSFITGAFTVEEDCEFDGTILGVPIVEPRAVVGEGNRNLGQVAGTATTTKLVGKKNKEKVTTLVFWQMQAASPTLMQGTYVVYLDEDKFDDLGDD